MSVLMLHTAFYCSEPILRNEVQSSAYTACRGRVNGLITSTSSCWCKLQ